MSNLIRIFFSCLVLLSCLSAVPVEARKQMRIIYVEAGPLEEYYNVLYGFAQGLQQAGFLKAQPPLASDKSNILELWDWLADNTDGRLCFLQDGFYSALWDDVLRRKMRELVQERLDKRQDVDAILVFGTRAGIDMATLSTEVPVLVTGVSDAVSAGIVPSVLDSGKDNLVAIIEPARYKQQVKFFHQIFPFKRLGIVYENNHIGRSMVSLDNIEAAASDLNVELVRCYAKQQDKNPDVVVASVESCHQKLVEKHVDAVYLTSNMSMTPEQKRRTLLPLIKAGIPTFSQVGVDDVKNGALASCVDASVAEGRFAATLLLDIFKGRSPRTLPQQFSSPLLLAINLTTATSIGWDPSLEVLLSVDEFYE